MEYLFHGRILPLLVFLVTLDSVAVQGNGSSAPFTYSGTAFSFTFLPSVRRVNKTSPYKIDLVATGNVTTKATVRVLNNNFSETYYLEPGKLGHISLGNSPSEIFSNGSDTVIVNSSAPIGVIAFIFKVRPSAAFQVIPTDTTGTYYVLASHEAEKKRDGRFAVTSHANNNTISLNMLQDATLNCGPSTGKSFVLDKDASRICMAEKGVDLTRTEITSTFRISVVVGGQKAMAIGNVSKKGFVLEQMLPRSTWSTAFAVAPFAKIGSVDNYELTLLIGRNEVANLTIRTLNSSKNIIVKGEDYNDTIINNNLRFDEVVQISSNVSIAVVQYMVGSSDLIVSETNRADPSIVNVPAVDYFTNYVLVDVFESEINENLINVIVDCETEPDGFMIDGVRTAPWNTVTHFDGARYCAHVFNLTSGLHCVSHTSQNASFSVTLYSWKIGRGNQSENQRNSYAINAGLSVDANYPTCVPKTPTTTVAPDPMAIVKASVESLCSELQSDNLCGNLTTMNGAAGVARKFELIALKLAEELVRNNGSSQTYDVGAAVIDIYIIQSNVLTGVTIPDRGRPDQSRTRAFIDQSIILEHQVKAIISIIFKSLGGMIDNCSSSSNDSNSSDPAKDKGQRVGSDVISLNFFPPITSEVILPDPVEMMFAVHEEELTQAMCSFWNYTSNGWSDKGCKTLFSNSTFVHCSCNHLTNFAVLMQINSVQLSQTHIITANILTRTGCIVSIAGAVLTVITLLLLRLRSDRVLIHLNLAIALGLGQALFLCLDIPVKTQVSCTILASLLYYFFLSTFCWMLIEGVNLYLQAVVVFNKPGSRMRIYMVIGWLCPLLPLACTLGFYRANLGDDVTTTDQPICFVRIHNDSIWFFVVPVLAIIAFNLFFIVRVIIEIVKLAGGPHGVNDRLTQMRHGLRACVILLPVMGLTWVFGVMWQDASTVIFMYLFILFNSLQGFLLFILHCLLNSEVRGEVLRKREQWRMLKRSSLSLRPLRGTSDDSKKGGHHQNGNMNRSSTSNEANQFEKNHPTRI